MLLVCCAISSSTGWVCGDGSVACVYIRIPRWLDQGRAGDKRQPTQRWLATIKMQCWPFVGVLSFFVRVVFMPIMLPNRASCLHSVTACVCLEPPVNRGPVPCGARNPKNPAPTPACCALVMVPPHSRATRKQYTMHVSEENACG